MGFMGEKEKQEIHLFVFLWRVLLNSSQKKVCLVFHLKFLRGLVALCAFPLNQPLWHSCVSAKHERGRKGEGEETDSQDLDEPWEKRGLVEEKQKCLRTFLCDYTGPDKSRHSFTYSVSLKSESK